MLSKLSDNVKQYLVITFNYWAFTLTDGALRMLVVLHFHQLGYGPLQIAMLFIFYEFFGVVTNLLGGWLGARVGLNKTMNLGLFIQLFALSLLLFPHLSIALVMFAQALSGIAKDLNKMSAKSSIKSLVNDHENDKLFKWVAILTGSKNSLKGMGFFLGGFSLWLFGFTTTILIMLVGLGLVSVFSLIYLKQDLGKAKTKPKFNQIFSKNKAINLLSGARLFLFSARDVWFVVALPVYLSEKMQWDHWWVSGYFALWIIFYGVIQGIAPKFVAALPTGKISARWGALLGLVPLVLAFTFESSIILMIGLMVFAVLFAINSSVHSYLIVYYADREKTSLDVGFYYMSNAMGRLIGTVLSGLVYQLYGLTACLTISAIFITIAGIIIFFLPQKTSLKSTS